VLCEHRCHVNRAAGELGKCKAGVAARVFRHRIEYGEERELIPSQLFYLSGCDLRCSFCIAEENAFNPSIGTDLTPSFFRRAVQWGREQGASTIQWVGGEPTIHIPAVLRAMDAVNDLPPIVWKSDFYATPEALELLYGTVAVFVADFKFGNDACAEHVASVPRYLEVVTRNLALAAAKADLIVRHLLLPGHFECCYIPIVRWLADNMPEVKFSLRDGYRPRWLAKHDPLLAGQLTLRDVERARSFAQEAGLHIIH
jgi:putative pyruvate formate lyase activating enzyme